jgi:hypothetical protein
MLIKLVEILVENVHTKINESVPRYGKEYALKEIYVNPEHVVMMRDNKEMVKKISKHKLSEDLHPQQEFTTLRINSGHSGMDVTIVGSLSAIQEKLNLNKKQLLKG